MSLGKAYANERSKASFQAVLAELTRLDRKLSQDGLVQFIVFNRAYLIITNNIQNAAKAGYFKSPEFIERFTACFASYYFDALNKTVTASPELPEAWALVSRAAEHKKAPNFIYLLMGANAHINYDLPLALLETMGRRRTDELLGDVIKVDKLLMKSGREIIAAFDEQNKLLNTLKRRLVFLYYRPVMYMILLWRIRAWRSYKSIKKTGKAGGYAKGSVRIANRFLKLSQHINHPN